ncbi:MAG: hypothetical protein KJO07_18610, partial [Deltaproteobacteria bacterium]|nr:hypothetical protein [Deltaproteobacteria bacterium]
RPSGPITGPVPKATPGAVTMRSEPGTQMSPLARPATEPPVMPAPTPAPATPPPADRVGLLRASQAVPRPPQARPRRRSSWPLVILTIVSVAVLSVGIVLKLTGPGTDASAKAPATDAGPPDAAPAPPDAAPKPLEIPEGMVVVNGADGRPSFFISKVPVTRGGYKKMFPRQKPGGSSAKSAVTRISNKYARSYAEAAGARLPTADELLTARKAKAIAASGLHEWTSETKGKRRVALSPAGKRESRRDKGYRNLTFRLVKDLVDGPQAPKKTK